MSDLLTQEQIDSMILDRLPSYAEVEGIGTKECPECRCPTKRLVFGGNFPARIRIVSDTGRTMVKGKIPANSIFCFGCGKFFGGE